MNAPTRKPLVGKPFLAEEIRADPVEVFRLRCGSRAKLWHNGEIDLHSAVDELQHAAEASGLVNKIGQDAVQSLMVEAFAPLRDDLNRPHEVVVPDDPWSAPGWRDAAIDYHKTRNGRADSRAASSSPGLTVRTNAHVASRIAGMNVDTSTSTQPGKPNSRRAVSWAVGLPHRPAAKPCGPSTFAQDTAVI